MTLGDSTTLADFLDAAAAKRPAPGGGAVAALTGALAASMGEMVLNYSVGKKSLSEHAAANGEVLAGLSRARRLLMDWMTEDQSVFDRLTDARKQGGDTKALVDAAIEVPMSVGATALSILEAAVRVAPTSNSYLASDLAVCGDLAMATVRAAVHNVRANLPDVDPSRRLELEAECRRMLATGVKRVNALTAAIEQARGVA